MTIASLNKMTVPLPGGFGTDQSPNAQGLLMPKLKYRFRVTFVGLGVSQPTTELTKQVIDFTRPSLSFEEMTVPIYNSTVYLAGKHSWEAVAVNLRDDAGNNVAKLVGEQLQKQLDFVEQASAASGIDYKFTTVCQILDGGNGAAQPTVIEEWQLYGCYLTSVNYNDLNYGESAPVTITMNIRFDNAIQSPYGVGVGATAGRTVAGAITGGSTAA